MSRFSTILRGLNEQLDLPQPARSRIVLEIHADLEDLFAYYLNKGHGEDEAEHLAVERLGLTDEIIQELIQIHTTPLRRWLDRVVGQTHPAWETGLLLTVFVVMAVISTDIFINTRFLQNTSTFVLPIFGIGLYALARSLEKFFRLFVKRDHRMEHLRQGMPTLLFMGGLSLVVGIAGYFLEMYFRGGDTMLMETYFFLILPTGAPGHELRLYQITDSLMRCSSLMMFCLLVTMLIAVIWYLLESKIIRIELAEASLLFKKQS